MNRALSLFSVALLGGWVMQSIRIDISAWWSIIHHASTIQRSTTVCLLLSSRLLILWLLFSLTLVYSALHTFSTVQALQISEALLSRVDSPSRCRAKIESTTDHSFPQAELCGRRH